MKLQMITKPETDYELEPGTESTEEADDFAFGDDIYGSVLYEEPQSATLSYIWMRRRKG